MHTLRLLLAAAIATLAGCGPHYGIDVTSVGGSAVFVLETCAGKPVDLEYLLVSDEANAALGCSIAHASGSPSVMRWEYGRRPPGYLMSKCAPLEPEHVYSALVDRPEAERRFKVLRDGTIESIGSLCE
jgi:hypothetical protein